jgi:peptide chain release factor 3
MPDTLQTNRPDLPPEIARRRTFAIISHPDAGKTTLTEKFLLYGGAIQMAGQVRAKGEARRTRSDFMKMEQDRGISVSASAMSFDFGKYRFNLVDTPGHSDFSEDTYRTLTAVDAAIMVIDGAKGVESQTQKLFEVCRLRDLPILTFCNKMDRESRDTFEIIDEIQENLAIDVTPASWPIGMGRDFLGCYDLIHDRLELMDRADRNKVARVVKMEGLDDPKLAEHIPAAQLAQLREEVEMARELLPPMDKTAFHQGTLTPIWFGSAINSFGVKELMDGIAEYGPEPQVQNAEPREVAPEEKKVAGFVFKVQANMDPKHRDRVAFVRLASGHFQRGMKLTHVRSKKPMAISNPVLFLASDRELAEEAWAGDIIGIPNHGQLRIGDALTEGEGLRFTGIPSFAPELLQTCRAGDPLKAKHLDKALMQFAEEGAAKVFKPTIGSGFIVGVVGALQFEVLASRIELEYGLARPLRAVAIHLRPLGLGPQGQGGGLRRRQQAAHGRRQRRRPGLPDADAVGHRPGGAGLSRRQAQRDEGTDACSGTGISITPDFDTRVLSHMRAHNWDLSPCCLLRKTSYFHSRPRCSWSSSQTRSSSALRRSLPSLCVTYTSCNARISIPAISI